MKNYKFNIKHFKLVSLLIFGLALSGCQMELYSSLSEDDANNMLSIMLSNGISSEKIKNKKSNAYALMIDENKIPKAIDLLKEHGYPREKVTGIEELFKKEGLVSSPMEERVRYIYALSQSVQETLSQIDGVLTARVHIVMPENNPFIDTIKPSSASVFIKYHPSSDIKNIKSKIKLIVEKSIEGLSYDKVSVVMLPAQLSYTRR
ncbi:MAG TPA: EscJ/YscJ/HrcJ family type III secretion inner membrane ring protein [Leucothrix mucor]|uniref:Lipoprotein n=1 Tax=Leucothrix mucor TaxID=45248 RepID=A0A7V2T3C4_LEUMU|nr:EscJ/YscJ/HrcJ family type III secretion inner membrane ring protein [Leucothrix mucor]